MASGYDFSSKVPYRLMQGRLGVYEKPYNPTPPSVEGVAHLGARLNWAGGNREQERMIRDKRRSLDRALHYSYQAATIARVIESAVPWSLLDEESTRALTSKALINPNKLKQDYDDKIVSIPFESGYKAGDIFEWLGTGTYWLIYLQNLTELAYFRGDIRKCCYQIRWQDDEGNIHSSFAATRGPVETKINFIQKNGISIDTPNHSLHILMPKTQEALDYFRRYSKFYLWAIDGPSDYAVCWRVEATDWISTPGVLEMTAVEYYANKDEDDIEAGIVGALIQQPEDPNEGEAMSIVGETFIRVKQEYTFTFDGTYSADWFVDKKYPVILKPDTKDPRNITLCWDSPYSGQFELIYGDYSKTIVVESLF